MLAMTTAVAGWTDALVAAGARSAVLARSLTLFLVTDGHRPRPLAIGLADQRRTWTACSIIR